MARRIIPYLAIAALVCLLIGLSGCTETPDPVSEKIARSPLIKVCRDGTWIGRDPLDGSLVAMKPITSYSRQRSIIPAGITADQICEGAR